MSTTPFRDTARKIAKEIDYTDMQVRCHHARSHAWWRNLVQYGAWHGLGVTESDRLVQKPFGGSPSSSVPQSSK